VRDDVKEAFDLDKQFGDRPMKPASIKPKSKRYLFDHEYDGRYVRAWSDGKGRHREIVVQVWNSGKPEGEPDGEWGMPPEIGVASCISCAVAQTKKV
jgi:hypothetical protein